MTQVKIGIIDSGVGGLSVLKEVYQVIPNGEFFYYCDDQNSPYGIKEENELLPLLTEAVEVLLARQCELIVLACNTATASVIDELRNKYTDIPFVGIEPYVNIINHRTDIEGPLALLATELTTKSERFKKLLSQKDPNGEIKVFGLKNLATIVENSYWNEWSAEVESKIREEIEQTVSGNYSHVLLGCTHYSLVAKTLENLLCAETIDPASAVARRVKSLLKVADKVSRVGDPMVNEFCMFKSKEKSWRNASFESLRQWPK